MKKLALLEIVAIFSLVEIRIWALGRLGIVTAIATVLPILLVCLSWRKAGDNFKTLGLVPENFKKDLIPIFAITLLLWVLILSIALIFNPEFLKQKNLVLKISLHFSGYFFWALLQNLWLNGYFVNRLSAAIKNPKIVSVIAGLLFAIVHLPNPVLFPVTLIGGIMSAHFFQRNRNLYLIAASHALLAVSLLYFFPDSWHHRLTIGPGFYIFKLK